MDDLVNNIPTKTKYCKKCLLVKPLNCFRKRRDRKDGLSSICKECYMNVCKNNTKKIVEEKKCNTCLEIKKITNFYKHSWKVDGYFDQCKECYLKLKEEKIKKLSILVSKLEYKTCVECKKVKSSDEFRKNKLSFDGLYIRCKTCEKEKRLKKRTELKEKVVLPRKKLCLTCKVEKTSDNFYKNSSRSDGLRYECKQCTYERKKRNFEIKTEEEKQIIHKKISVKAKEYRDHSDLFKQYRKEYNIKNRKRRSAYTVQYEKRKYYSDLNFKILYLLRRRLRYVLKGKTKSKATIELLGCTLEEFREYFSSYFTEGMTWEKYLNGEKNKKIAIDHILPCSHFDLSCAEEQKICFNYLNLQPLWSTENSIKGNRLDYQKNINVPWGDPNLSFEERKLALRNAIIENETTTQKTRITARQNPKSLLYSITSAPTIVPALTGLKETMDQLTL